MYRNNLLFGIESNFYTFDVAILMVKFTEHSPRG